MERLKEIPKKQFQPYHTLTVGQETLPLEKISENCQEISVDINWVTSCLSERLGYLIADKKDSRSIQDIELLPELTSSNYNRLIQDHQLGYVERSVLMLSFIYQFIPSDFVSLLNDLEISNQKRVKAGFLFNRLTETYIPTLQTALFLLSGTDMRKRFYYSAILEKTNPLFKEGIVTLASSQSNNHDYEGILSLNPAYASYFKYGGSIQLDYSPDFPATLLKTEKTFADLVVSPSILEDLKAPLNFVKYQKKLYQMEEVSRKISPGYVVLLYGEPGTGKTLTASVLGKEAGVDVYHVNFARVISKYIGETEKNLEKIFDRLESKNCILFFDEADALFGKRTDIKDAKDRYANQETSYLLQRIETWNGLIIMATNFDQNLDAAFERRILTKIRYEPPALEERLKLWKVLLPAGFQYDSGELLEKLASSNPLSGGSIAKIIKLCCIQAVSQNRNILTKEDLYPLIKTECFRNKLQVRL